MDLSVPSGPYSRLPDYADTPLFPVGPLSPHEVRAFQDLIDHGIQIVICTKSKPPLWPSWNLRYPALSHIVHHDALIGHVPGALLLVVFDIDAGSPDEVERFCAAYPPLLQVPSLQSGHHHLYYRSDKLVGNARFRWQGIAGDIRCLGGYVVLWGKAAILLRDALRNTSTPTPAPLHLIQVDAATPRAEPTADTVSCDRYGAPAPLPVGGSPNPTVFEQVSHWAYRSPRGSDRSAWDALVLEKTLAINASLISPLSPREAASVAKSIAKWVWEHFDHDHLPGHHGSRQRGRRDGIASGAARRRGTPLADDRKPWEGLGISRATWYRRFRYCAEDQTPVPKPWRPWLRLGISPDAWRQRLKRARDGSYRGADAGVPRWEALGVTEPEWAEWYAPRRAAESTETHCHGSETEPLIVVGAVCEGGAGLELESVPVPVIGDPVRSAETLMDGVDTCGGPTPGPAEGLSKKEFKRLGNAIRNAERKLRMCIDRERNQLIKKITQISVEAAVTAYLKSREPAHLEELRRRGLPEFGLLRPQMPFDDYDRNNPAHRKRYAIMMRQDHDHNLRTAKYIYEQELRLGQVPLVAPWDAAVSDVKRRSFGWTLPPGWLKGWRTDMGYFWRDRIAAEYSVSQTPTTLPEVDDSPILCDVADCDVPIGSGYDTCMECRRAEGTDESCPTCGEESNQLMLRLYGECPWCSWATAEERDQRALPIVAAWEHLRSDTLPPPVHRHPDEYYKPPRRSRKRRYD